MNTKNNLLKLNAVVIGERDYKEYDKLITLLTEKRGKIYVYAFNVRKPKAKNIGKIRLFTFGTFEIRDYKNSYQLENVILKNSFNDLSMDYNDICYASYFIELADYFGLENMICYDIYSLLYYTFKALVAKKVPKKLIKRVYELKTLKYQGLYKESDKLLINNKVLKYTWDFVLGTLPQKLYTFILNDEIFKLFDDEMSIEMREKVGKKFKSLELIID